MKSVALFLGLCMSVCLLACSSQAADHVDEGVPAGTSRQLYQLKIFSFASQAQAEATDGYLKEAFLPALKRQQIGPVGVFKNRLSETDTLLKTYVLIPFSGLEQFKGYESTLRSDQAYMAAGQAYLTTPHDQPAYLRINAILMEAFEEMPLMAPSPVEGSRADRVYELRSYESATEDLYRLKVDMFNGGGEIKLFDRLNFNAVFYGEVLAGPNMPNLMYMTTFPNQAVRDSLWKEFIDSPEWTELKEVPKYKHTVSHADIHLLYPTAYSDY